ncbi:VrrA/YqfQ family protein [Metasolibacillus meyeri]|uniref:VrrA/YqfQ family protein n=1 Tax=Metasolibacillus meyeri TaxID=1071052 RepID=A0AAW9NU91_9BACL|nr:VrrA/YqfQ family protein [Metasolibacillus meyeri]MEC1179967.1 VrrA/YqfQ family protein [Metasolibacillus meyeri]
MRPLPYFQMPTPYAAPPYAFMPRGFTPFMRVPPAMPMPPMGMPMQAAQAAQTAAAAAPKWETFLQTANSFMNNAQKFTPYVQQAAPMIKNLPALWRMYRGFRSSPDESSTIRAPRREASPSLESTNSYNERQTRPSVPRIYQPPFEF